MPRVNFLTSLTMADYSVWTSRVGDTFSWIPKRETIQECTLTYDHSHKVDRLTRR